MKKIIAGILILAQLMSVSVLGFANETQNQAETETVETVEAVVYPEWTRALESVGTYTTGFKVSYQGKNYEQVASATAWWCEPGTNENIWKEIVEIEDPETPEEPTEPEVSDWEKTYNASTGYKPGDIVKHNGKIWLQVASYISRWNEPGSNSDVWQEIEEDENYDYSNVVLWDLNYSNVHGYVPGSKVSHNGYIWEQVHTNPTWWEEPGVDETKWKNTGISIASDETVGEIYFKDFTTSEQIKYNGEGIYYFDNQLLLTANEDISFEEVEELISENGANIVGYIELTNDYQIEYRTQLTYEELTRQLDLLSGIPEFSFASLNTIISSGTDSVYVNDDTPSDPFGGSAIHRRYDEDNPTGNNWGLELVKAASAWSYIKEEYDYSSISDMQDGMNTVKLGIIDTMFDSSHPDLDDVFEKVWSNPSSLWDDHGTHVAGIMAAEFNNGEGIAGVVVNKELYAFSLNGESDPVFRDLDNGNNDISAVMEYKYALALLIGNGAKVINVSMNTGVKQLVGASIGNSSALNYIETNANIIEKFLITLLDGGYDFNIVVAAGNHNNKKTYKVSEYSKYGVSEIDYNENNTAIDCDSQYTNFLNTITRGEVKDRIIVVGNLENIKNDNKEYKMNDSSSQGERVDLAAPGSSIYSAVRNGFYSEKTGTSMATPLVSSLAGLIYEINPGLSGKQVKEILVSTADGKIQNEAFKYINCLEAVKKAISTTGTTPPVAQPSGIIIGQVLEAWTKDPVKNAKVCAYKFDESNLNLDTQIVQEVTTTNEQGSFEFVLSPGKYAIKIIAEGYESLAIYDLNVSPEGIEYIERTLMVDWFDQKGSVGGTITDALTGEIVEGATIKFRDGWNNKTGEYQDFFDVSDEDGKYKVIESERGYFTVEVTKDGYITGYSNVIVDSSTNSYDQNIIITPVLSEKEYRIVLTWGETPADLDSHLIGTGFHVYYRDKDHSADGVTVNLDVDDTSSYGPETITLKIDNIEGVYTYRVHDFTNQNATGSNAMSLSGAQVKVYKGNTLQGTYNVPINKSGTWWTVFEIENGVINSLNTII